MALVDTESDRDDAARKRASSLDGGSGAPALGVSGGTAAMASAAGLISAGETDASTDAADGGAPTTTAAAGEDLSASDAPSADGAPSAPATAAQPDAAPASAPAPAAATIGGHTPADAATSAGGGPAAAAISPIAAWSGGSIGSSFSGLSAYLSPQGPLVDETSSDSSSAGGSGEPGSIAISAGPSPSPTAPTTAATFGYGSTSLTGSLFSTPTLSTPSYSSSDAFAATAAAKLAAYEAARDDAQTDVPTYTPPTLDDRLAEALQKLSLGGGATTIVSDRSASSKKVGGTPDVDPTVTISTIPDQDAFVGALDSFLKENGMSGFSSPLSALTGSGSIFDNLIAEDKAPLSLELSGGSAAIGEQAHTSGEVTTVGSSGLSADAIKGVSKFTASAEGPGAQADADSGAAVSGADFVFVYQYDAAFGGSDAESVSATHVMAINYAGFDLAGGPVIMGQSFQPSLSTTGIVNQLAPGVGGGRNGPDYEHNQSGVAFNSAAIDPLDLSEAVVDATGSSLATEFASLSTGTSSVEIFF